MRSAIAQGWAGGWQPRRTLVRMPALPTRGQGMAAVAVLGLLGLAFASLGIPRGGPWVFLATIVLALGAAMTFLADRPPLPIREVILGLHYLFYILPLVFMQYFPPPLALGPDLALPPNLEETFRAASLALSGLAAGLYLPIFLLWRPRLRWAGRLDVAAGPAARIRTVLWIIWLFGFLAEGSLHVLGSFLGPLQSEMSSLGELQLAAILSGYSLKFGRPEQRRWWAPHLWAAVMIFRVTVLKAFMTWSILIVLAIGMVYVFRRGRIPWLTAVALFFVALTWQTIKPMFRQVAWGSRSAGVVDRLTALWDLSQEKGLPLGSRTKTRPLTSLAMRLNQSYYLGRMLVWTPSRVAFAEGATIQNAIEHVIYPRFLFEKKSVGGTSNLVVKYAGIDVPRWTSIGVGYVCEWYLNFGVPGVVWGMFLIGALFQIVYRVARAAGLQGHLVLGLILYVIWPSLNIQCNLAEVLGAIVQHFVFSGLVIALIFATAAPARRSFGVRARA